MKLLTLAACAVLACGCAVHAQDLTGTSSPGRAVFGGGESDSFGASRPEAIEPAPPDAPLDGSTGDAMIPALPEAALEAEGGEGGEFAYAVASAFVPTSVQLRLGLSSQIEYNTNVTVRSGSESGPRGSRVALGGGDAEDLIFLNTVQISTLLGFSGGRSLGVDLDVGYRHYLENTQLSGLVLNTKVPGGVRFSFPTGDVRWTVHDVFSFTTDPADEPELSNATDFSRFTNSAGLDAAWIPVSRVMLNAGYERFDLISNSSEFGNRDRTSHSLRGRATYALGPLAQTGLTASATFTQPGGSAGNRSRALALGAFVNGSITHATSIVATGGLQTLEFENGDMDSGSGGGESFYASLRVTNKLTNFYSHAVDVGRQVRLGTLSNSVATDYLRYSGSLPVGRRASLVGNVFVEESEQSGGAVTDRFRRYGGGVSLQVALRPTLSGALGWQTVSKDSDAVERSYSQQRVYARISWLF